VFDPTRARELRIIRMSDQDLPERPVRDPANGTGSRLKYLRVYGLGIESIEEFRDQIGAGAGEGEADPPSVEEIRGYESGEPVPDAFIGRVCEVFAVNEIWLLEGAGDVTHLGGRARTADLAWESDDVAVDASGTHEEGDAVAARAEERRAEGVLGRVAAEFPPLEEASSGVLTVVYETALRVGEAAAGLSGGGAEEDLAHAAVALGRALRHPCTLIAAPRDQAGRDAYILSVCQSFLLLIRPTR